MTTEAELQPDFNRNQYSFFLLLLGVCLPLLIFALLAIAIIQNRKGFPWDVSLSSAIHNIAIPTLDIFASARWMLAIAWGICVNLLFQSSLVKLITRKQDYP